MNKKHLYIFVQVIIVTLTFNLVIFPSCHVLTESNQHVKKDSSVIKSSQENEQKPFFTKRTWRP